MPAKSPGGGNAAQLGIFVIARVRWTLKFGSSAYLMTRDDAVKGSFRSGHQSTLPSGAGLAGAGDRALLYHSQAA